MLDENCAIFSHPDEQVVWTYGMTAPLIAGSNEMVAALFRPSQFASAKLIVCR